MSGKLLGAELNDIARMAEGRRLKKSRWIEAEKEEGGRVVMGRNMI